MTDQNSSEKKNAGNHSVAYNDLTEETQKLLRKTQLKHVISQQYHQAHFGNTPPIMGIDFNGRRLVAVGGSLVTSDDPNYDWEKPSDFLVSYLKSKIGLEWFSDQIKQNFDQRHEIVKWYSKGMPNVEKGNEYSWDTPNGKALALLHLAYDLFVLDHLSQLPDFIIDRLKNDQNFNGARYELFVFSTLIRAGFNIKYCDERSGSKGRVPECKAIHRQTSQEFFVEAKTRNVKSILGATQGKASKIRLYDKLKNAMEKNVDGPYVIFVDINHPNIKAQKGNSEFEKVRSEYQKLEKEYKNSMPNMVCFTNIPFHYGADHSKPDQNLFGLMFPHFPKYELTSKNEIFALIDASLKTYDFLPKEFNESETYANTILDGAEV